MCVSESNPTVDESPVHVLSRMFDSVVSDHAQTGTYNNFMNRQVRWAKLLAPTDRAPESAERSESRHMEGDHGAKGNVL